MDRDLERNLANDDTAHHGRTGGKLAKDAHDSSDSALKPGTVLGKKGSQVPLVAVQHTGEQPDLKGGSPPWGERRRRMRNNDARMRTNASSENVFGLSQCEASRCMLKNSHQCSVQPEQGTSASVHTFILAD
jgi:hypothetical protein